MRGPSAFRPQDDSNGEATSRRHALVQSVGAGLVVNGGAAPEVLEADGPERARGRRRSDDELELRAQEQAGDARGDLLGRGGVEDQRHADARPGGPPRTSDPPPGGAGARPPGRGAKYVLPRG